MKGKTDPAGELSGFLDERTEFRGEISFQDTLRIDGKFEGSIRSGRLLIIGETAEVNADIDVGSISVRGGLRGNVSARERIELHATARCQCNLDTRVLVVAEGALFEGSCAMQGTQHAAGGRPALSGVDNVKKFVASE